MSIYIGGGYTNPKLSNNDIKSEIRNLKLKVISGEFSINFSDVNIKKHSEELNFILNRLSENDVITGSLALKLYGLLDRQIGDIDVIIDNPDRYKDYKLFGYGDLSLKNRLGYKRFIEGNWWLFNKREFQVDFFQNEDVNFIEMDFTGRKLKIHNPIDIINHKLYMFSSNYHEIRDKHHRDLVQIFNVINSVY